MAACSLYAHRHKVKWRSSRPRRCASRYHLPSKVSLCLRAWRPCHVPLTQPGRETRDARRGHTRHTHTRDADGQAWADSRSHVFSRSPQPTRGRERRGTTWDDAGRCGTNDTSSPPHHLQPTWSAPVASRNQWLCSSWRGNRTAREALEFTQQQLAPLGRSLLPQRRQHGRQRLLRLTLLP